MPSNFASIVDLQVIMTTMANSFETYQQESQEFIDALCYTIPVEQKVTRFPFSKIPGMLAYKEKLTKVSESDVDDEHIDLTLEVFGRKVTAAEEDIQYLGGKAQAFFENKALEVAKTSADHANFWRTSIMTATAIDPVLMPDDLQGTAYDGLALYSSSTRFQTTGGNIVTKTGTDPDDIKTDFFSAHTRFSQFRHDKANLRLIPFQKGRHYIIEYPTALTESMVTAFQAEFVSQGGAGTQAVSNTLKAYMKTFGASVELMENRLLSGTTWYIHIINIPNKKPFFLGKWGAPESYAFGPANDTDGRDHYMRGFTFIHKYGLCSGLPFTTISVQ